MVKSKKGIVLTFKIIIGFVFILFIFSLFYKKTVTIEIDNSNAMYFIDCKKKVDNESNLEFHFKPAIKDCIYNVVVKYNYRLDTDETKLGKDGKGFLYIGRSNYYTDYIYYSGTVTYKESLFYTIFK